MNESPNRHFDLLIIGSGIAGISAAIRASELGMSVAIVTKEESLFESNTRWAQGGIVGAAENDRPELLKSDILRAGAGINSGSAVDLLVSEGPALVRSFLLEQAKVPFTKDASGNPSLTREAAHSIRRIYYAMDSTGAAIQRSLNSYVAGLANVSVYTSMTAIDLITNVHNSSDPQEKYRRTRVIGAYILDNETSSVSTCFASTILLATGGIGELYLHTSNPTGATGDGLGMAYRIGAEIQNTEYLQFHPTVLYHQDVKRFLISEALRGEGARLRNHSGEYFMERYHPELKDLAPRDEVARAIYREVINGNSDYVYLDATDMGNVVVEDRFPLIFNQCMELGIDIRRDLIPVVPAAHYFCGGVKVDLHGRTTIDGLYAAGETACTGVHGANRLASVSLLEGLVWGHRAAEHAAASANVPDNALIASIPDWIEPTEEEEFDPILVKQDFQSIKSIMWNYAGIVRRRKHLLRAHADLNYLSHRIEQFYRSAKLTRRIIELRNGVLCAALMVRSALANPVSRGCHYME